MCGIVGIVSKAHFDLSTIRKMTQTLHHRGPDADGGFMNDGQTVALGHTRLSIIDLDPRSNQPFYSSDGRYIMVFNGEIYNYRSIAKELLQLGKTLRTTSDTEVLIEAFAVWGPEFVGKLEGMFAFVIFDKHLNQLYLCRDRVGIKPLYYFLSDDLFAFASEIKALLNHPSIRATLRINKSTLASFLQLGYIPQPNTLYKNIFKFPAGSYATFTTGFEFSMVPYWDITHFIRSSRDVSEEVAFDELKKRVTHAVTSRLVADVPMGIFLSGGIDSSLVAAVATRSKKLKTFSIGFKESKFDESVHAEQIARYLGTEHYRYILEQREAVDLVEQYVEHFDEPFADTSAIPTMLVSRYARKEVTVALTGDGGDELFLGYGSHTWANRLSNPILVALKPAIEILLKSMPSMRWKRASHHFENVKPENLRKHIFSQEQYFFSDKEIQHFALRDMAYYQDWPYNNFSSFSGLTEAERQALFDFQYYLRDDLLVKVDMASMLYGLECRCPLLDHNLVEFSVNLPEGLKKRNVTTKYLLKKMLYEMIPEQYFNRPKWGFSIPLAKWLKNELNYLMDYLSEEQLEKTGVFNVSYIRHLVDRFNKGEEYLYNRLWVVIISQRFILKHE